MTNEQQAIIDNLMRHGALRVSMLSSVAPGHYVLYSEKGPLDIVLEDLTEAPSE